MSDTDWVRRALPSCEEGFVNPDNCEVLGHESVYELCDEIDRLSRLEAQLKTFEWEFLNRCDADWTIHPGNAKYLHRQLRAILEDSNA